ncbi:MAG TPA: nucleotidyltransferase family protein [Solirubrobacteraceae bacterium]|jgi:hypothetical protein
MRGVRLPHRDQAARLVALVRGDEVAPADDDAFADAALFHNLAGFAVRAIEAGRWRPAGEVAARVRETHAERTLVTGLLRLELAACAETLANACGAPPVVVKGPAVAARLYAGDPELRPYVDLDLVVPRERLRAAADALVATRGFSLARGERYFAADGEPWPGFAETFGHELSLVRVAAARTLLVELQWRMSDDPLGSALDHPALLAHASGSALLPAGAVAPDALDELLLLAVHLLHHEEPLVIWCEDIARARDALDDAGWDGAFERARERGLSWPLHEALDRVAAVLGADRERPEAKPRAGAMGALRSTSSLPVGVGVHVGRLATLGWRQRATYVRRAAQASLARARTSRSSDSA